MKKFLNMFPEAALILMAMDAPNFPSTKEQYKLQAKMSRIMASMFGVMAARAEWALENARWSTGEEFNKLTMAELLKMRDEEVARMQNATAAEVELLKQELQELDEILK